VILSPVIPTTPDLPLIPETRMNLCSAEALARTLILLILFLAVPGSSKSM